jgi:hypothetical protein
MPRPRLPGLIHEGGELGYSLAHAFGAALDNPGLTVACVVGDGEAEAGPLAAAWHGNKFLNPRHDGTVLPILHLNGYKIANPTVLACMPREELRSLLVGYGYEPTFVDGDEPAMMHQAMAAAIDAAFDAIAEIRARARCGEAGRPRWAVVVLRSPKWAQARPSMTRSLAGAKTSGSYVASQVRRTDAGNFERVVGPVVGITNRDVLALNKSVRTEAVPGLVVLVRPVLVVDQPGRAALSAGAMHEAAMPVELTGPEAAHAAMVARLMPECRVEATIGSQRRHDDVAAPGTPIRILGAARQRQGHLV